MMPGPIKRTTSMIASRGHLHESFREPHNEYLRLVVDGGFIGMLIFVLAYGLQARQGLKKIENTDGTVLAGVAFLVLALENNKRTPSPGASHPVRAHSAKIFALFQD